MTGQYNNITLNSFNCRGLCGNNKRQTIFKWIENSHNGITLLQETHSSLSDEIKWTKEWGGTIFFSHGEYNAQGVAILVPKNLIENFELQKSRTDKDGRLISINCKLENS